MKTIILSVLGGVLALSLVALLALPAVLRGMGLHPVYTGQWYLLPEGRALIIATNHDQLGEEGRAAGVFGSELTAPYYDFMDGRMRVDVASIGGGKIPVDPWSTRRSFKTEYDDRFLSDPVLLSQVENSLRIDDVDFTEYDVSFGPVAGGRPTI